MALFKLPQLNKELAQGTKAEGSSFIKENVKTTSNDVVVKTGDKPKRLSSVVSTPEAKKKPKDSKEPKKLKPFPSSGISGAALREKLDSLFIKEKCSLITTKEELTSFLQKQEIFGLDTETTDLRWYVCTTAGFSLGTATESIYVPLNHTTGENYKDDINEMVELLLSKKYYGFNSKFDLLSMHNINKKFLDLNFVGDGYLAIRCYDNTLDAGLKDAYVQHIDNTAELYDYASLFNKPFTAYDPKDVYKYAAVDARKHYVVTEYFEDKLKETPKVYKVYNQIEMPLVKVITSMERHGIRMDEEYIMQLKQRLVEKAKPLQDKIAKMTSDTFNPNSPAQLKAEFHKRGIMVSSTNEETLQSLKGDELADLILELRGIQKSISSFTDGLLKYTSKEDGLTIAHPGFNQYGAATGRFSSSKFNIQQIPKDNDFRRIFIARPGHTLVSVDYSQQEVRVLAGLSQDPIMIKAFKDGKDFYSDMGSNIYELPYEDCLKHGKHKHIRQEMKGVVLGMNYDMQAESLGETIGKSTEEAQKILDSLEKKYHVMYMYKAKCLKFAKEHGYNETVFGRRRYYEGLGYRTRKLPRFVVTGAREQTEEILKLLPQLQRRELKEFITECKKNKPNKISIMDREAIQWSEQRQTTNSEVQGSSADMTKLAMLTFHNDPRSKQYKAKIALQIHDEIIIEVPDEYAEVAGQLLADIMNEVGSEMMDGLPMGGEPGYMKVWQKD